MVRVLESLLNGHPYFADCDGFYHRGGVCPTKPSWLHINEDSQQTGLGVRSWDNSRSFLLPDGGRLSGYVSSWNEHNPVLVSSGGLRRIPLSNVFTERCTRSLMRFGKKKKKEKKATTKIVKTKILSLRWRWSSLILETQQGLHIVNRYIRYNLYLKSYRD